LNHLAIICTFVYGLTPKERLYWNRAAERNVTEVDSATSVARKSFTGMIDQKKKIAASLSEGKDLAQLKDIRFVKPF
jgi:hypothetical protein